MTVLTTLTVQTIKTTSLTLLFSFFGNFTFDDYTIQAKLVLATFHLLTIYDVINSKHLWYIGYKYCLQIHHKRKKFLVTYFVEVLTTLTLDTACFSVLFSFGTLKRSSLLHSLLCNHLKDLIISPMMWKAQEWLTDLIYKTK